MHYSTLVILENTDSVIDSVEQAMAPFDENVEVTPYIYRYYDDLKKDVLGDVKKFYMTYPKYFLGMSHIFGLSLEDMTDDMSEYVSKFIDKAVDTDDSFVIENICRNYFGPSILFDNNHNLLSTYNPKSKFDWYKIGGRWDSLIEGNSCSVEDIPDISAYSILEPDGTWHDDMHNNFEFWKIVNKYKDGKHICVVVDRHI